jgi:hypothetical protein
LHQVHADHSCGASKPGTGWKRAVLRTSELGVSASLDRNGNVPSVCVLAPCAGQNCDGRRPYCCHCPRDEFQIIANVKRSRRAEYGSSLDRSRFVASHVECRQTGQDGVGSGVLPVVGYCYACLVVTTASPGTHVSQGCRVSNLHSVAEHKNRIPAVIRRQMTRHINVVAGHGN